MNALRISFVLLLVLSIGSAEVLAGNNKPGKLKPKKFPAFTVVKATVQANLAARKSYRSGDLLSRGEVDKALEAVADEGWTIDDRKAIVGSFLGDNDYLVRQLRTPRGTRFMRKLSSTPRTYDRLDRLRGLKFGNRRIRELINNPGGHTLILYMVKTQGGRNLGRYLNQVPGGRKFNKPTPRLYTEAQLIERLKQSYNTAAKKTSIKKNSVQRNPKTGSRKPPATKPKQPHRAKRRPARPFPKKPPTKPTPSAKPPVILK